MRVFRSGHVRGPSFRGVLAAVAMLAGMCAGAKAGRPLVFAVATLPLSLPVYVAQDQGFFAAEGAVVNVADCEIGRRCLDRMLDGGADLATVAVLPLVRAGLQGRGFGIVATMAAARNDAKIITRRGGADSAAALAGHRVGTFVGTSAHFLLDLSLLSAGVDPARVATVPLEPEDAAEALQSGRVDAVSLFEPFAWRTVRSLGDDARVLSDRRQHVESWMLVASAALDRSRDPDLAAVCRALVRAVRFIETEPVQAQLILQRRLALEPAAVAWVLPDVDYRVELRQSLLHGLEEQARWALRSGQSRGVMPNFLAFLRPAPLASVLPRAVTVVMP